MRELKGKSLIEIPNKYIAFDIETTGLDPMYDEIIEIGAIKIEDGKEIETFSTLQIIADLGGHCQDGVNKETNFLILGNNDYNPILRGKKSSKLLKAESLKLKGQDIEILSENVFYDVIPELKNSH